MSIKKIFIIVFVILLGLYLFYLYFPLMLVGPVMSVYYIDNNDSIAHDVTVEIFDEHNVSVYKKSYLLGSNKSVDLDREVQWWFPFPSKFITWNDGVYTFNFTVDYNYSKEITLNVTQYETISVDVFEMEPPDVFVPIRIRIATV